MISELQMRSARAALRWSVQELADRAGVRIQTIKRFEAIDHIPPSRFSTLVSIKAAFEAAGIEFFGAPEDGPGIRLWRPAPRD
jgi:transcriptional regulator with XRE-family HTH domain